MRKIPEVSRYKRWTYLGIGWFFFGLGLLGVFLPVLPTTPFMILALWAFSRSSQRFRDWLYHHPIFGKPLQRWSEHRVIPITAKLAAVGAMSASLAYLAFFTNTAPLLLAATAALMALGAGYVLSKPSRIPKTEQTD